MTNVVHLGDDILRREILSFLFCSHNKNKRHKWSAGKSDATLEGFVPDLLFFSFTLCFSSRRVCAKSTKKVQGEVDELPPERQGPSSARRL